MKIIIKLFTIICLCSSGVISQDFSVYKNTITGGTINGDFISDELYLDTNDKLASKFFESKEYINGTLSSSSIYYSSGFIDIVGLADPKELLAMYHLTKARNYAIHILGISDTFEYTDGNGDLAYTKITVVRENPFDDPIIQSAPSLTNPMLEYGYNPSAGYNALAEDAYAIVRGYFTLIYKVKSVNNPITSDGADMGLATYLAHRYMTQPPSYNTSNEVHTHGGHGANPNAWETLSDNLYSFLTPGYYKDLSQLVTDHKRSELLFAALWQVGSLTGYSKVDQLIVGSFGDLNNGQPTETKKQLDVALILYNNTHEISPTGEITNKYGFTDLDRCNMLDIFTDAYGTGFYDAVDPSSIPPSAIGDIYIKDNASHEGEEITPSGFVHNSPSIWNSYLPFLNFDDHQNPYASGAPSTQYVKIAIDGNFCDLQNIVKVVGDVQYKIYRSVPQLGYQWPVDWDNTNVHNDPEGDLIGTFTIKDPAVVDVQGNPTATYRDDLGQVLFSGEDIPYSNEGNLLIIALPWQVPDYLNDIYLPNIWPKVNNYGYDFQDAFLVRVVSNTYDPIASELNPGNVYLNVKNNNNIAMKTSNIVIAFECDPCSGGGGNTPGFLLPNDDEPDDVVIYIDPSTHDPVRPPSNPNPNPTEPEVFIPVRPEFNNYTDYGEVRIVLDEDTHQDWVANGSLGNGFVVNSDDEIIVTASDFKLRGIPRSVTGGPIRVMGVRYYADNGVLTSRTGFDVVAENSTGDFIGRIHFEVREDENSGVPRSSNDNSMNGDITIYPNPIKGDILYTENLATDGTYTIFGIDGKTHTQGRYTKDQKSLDISMLDSGVYFLQFATQNGRVETKKLIVLNN